MKNNKKKGFTLMELLIVIAIIVVLVAIAIPVFGGQLTKAKETTDIANIRSYVAEAQTGILSGDMTIDTANGNFDDIASQATGCKVTLNYESLLTVGDVDSTKKTFTVAYAATKVTPQTWTVGEGTIN